MEPTDSAVDLAYRARLGALRRKYETMLALRLAHDAGDPADPRRAMAALASEFPGALREIDELPLDHIRARIEALVEAEANGVAQPWMRAIDQFHAGTRGALCAKKWLAGRKVVDDAMRAAFLVDATTLCWAEDALAWAEDLERIANPPRGRVTDLVITRIAATTGITADEVRALVFPSARRARGKK